MFIQLTVRVFRELLSVCGWTSFLFGSEGGIRFDGINSWPRGYRTFLLNSVEHEIFSAHKCKNANNCWHFKIYEQEK